MQSRTAALLLQIHEAIDKNSATPRNVKNLINQAGPDILLENMVSIDFALNIINCVTEADRLSYISALLKNRLISLSEQFDFFEKFTANSHLSLSVKAELSEALLTRILQEPAFASASSPNQIKAKKILEQSRRNLIHALSEIKMQDTADAKTQLDIAYLTALDSIKQITQPGGIEKFVAEADKKEIPKSNAKTETEIAKIIPIVPGSRVKAETFPNYSTFDATALTAELAAIAKRMQNGDPCDKDLQKAYCQENIRILLAKNAELENEFQKLNSQSVNILANALICLDRDKFAAIDSDDFFFDTQKEPATAITNAIKFFNQTSSYIVNDITSRESIDEITLALEHWLRVADKCLNNPELQDSCMAFCIASALNHSAVSRLKKSFEGLSKPAQKIMRRLDEIKDFHGNFANLRSYHEDTQHANAIPYFAIYLSQFNGLRENSSFAKAHGIRADASAVKLNFKLRNIIKNLRKIRLPSIDYKVIENKITSLNFNEDEAFKRSTELEPRDNSLPPSKLGHESLYQKEGKRKETKAAQPQPPLSDTTNSQHAMMILDAKDADFLRFLSLFEGTSGIVVTDADAHARLAEAGNRANDFIEANKRYFEKDDQRKLRLYYWKLRGKENDVDLSMLNPVNQEKIKKTISEPNFVSDTLEAFRTAIRDDLVTQQILIEYNEKGGVPVDPSNAFNLHRYATELYTNTKHKYVTNFEPMDEPPLRKFIATLYLLTTQENFFTSPLTDGPVDRLLKQNRVELASLFLTQLSQKEFIDVYRVLNSKNPLKPNENIMDLLPAPVQHTVEELYYELSLSFFSTPKKIRENQNKRLNEVTPKVLNQAKNILTLKQYHPLENLINDFANYARGQAADDFGVTRAGKIIEILSTLSTYATVKEMMSYIDTKLKKDPDIKSHRHTHLPDIHPTTDFDNIFTKKKTTLEKHLEALHEFLAGTISLEVKPANPAKSTKTEKNPAPAENPPGAGNPSEPKKSIPKAGAEIEPIERPVADPTPLPAAEKLNIEAKLAPVLDQLESFLATAQRDLQQIQQMHNQLHVMRNSNTFFAHPRLEADADKPNATPSSGIHLGN